MATTSPGSRWNFSRALHIPTQEYDMPDMFTITMHVKFRPWARVCLWLAQKMVNAGLRLIAFATDHGVQFREVRK